jgi:hypothetical protein
MALIDWSWTTSDWVLLLLVIAVALYCWSTSNYNHFSKQNVPFVKPRPLVGSMWPVLRRKEYFPQLMLRIYNELNDHPYAGFFIFKQPIVVLRDPALIKTIAVKDFEYFTDHRAMLSEDAEPVWSRGLFNLKGRRGLVCERDRKTNMQDASPNYILFRNFGHPDDGGAMLLRNVSSYKSHTA